MTEIWWVHVPGLGCIEPFDAFFLDRAEAEKCFQRERARSDYNLGGGVCQVEEYILAEDAIPCPNGRGWYHPNGMFTSLPNSEGIAWRCFRWASDPAGQRAHPVILLIKP